MKDLRDKQIKWFPGYTGEYRSVTSARFWWLAVFSHDPADDLEKIKIPVLTLLGERDLSFPAIKVKEKMERSFIKAGNKNYAFKIFPEAEHQIVIPRYYNGKKFRRADAPDYIKTILDWLEKRVKARPAD